MKQCLSFCDITLSRSISCLVGQAMETEDSRDYEYGEVVVILFVISLPFTRVWSKISCMNYEAYVVFDFYFTGIPVYTELTLE
jgi:hypothetical protein